MCLINFRQQLQLVEAIFLFFKRPATFSSPSWVVPSLAKLLDTLMPRSTHERWTDVSKSFLRMSNLVRQVRSPIMFA